MDTRMLYLDVIVTVLVTTFHVCLSLNNVTFSILEELPSGSYIGSLKTEARLEDTYRDRPSVLDSLTFTILPPDNQDAIASDYFEVEENTGILKVSSVIDRDDVRLCAYQTSCQMTFEVAVGPVQHFRVLNVLVNILDVNDNSPQFSKDNFNLNISESALPGSTYNLPSVHDLDSSKFGIQRFAIEPNNGIFNVTWSRDLQGKIQPKLKLRRVLDREEIHTFDLSIVAFDSGSTPNSVRVHVTVQDTNDNDPEFSLPTYETRIEENSRIGTSVIEVHAEDPDVGDSGTVRYSLSAPNIGQGVSKFRIDPVSGVIYLEGDVDREDQDVYFLSVIATDQAKDMRQASTSVTIHIDDVNDNAPVIRVSVITTSGRAEVLESAEVGTFVALVSVTDRDWGQNSEVTCQLSSNKFLLQAMEPKNKFKIVTDSRLDREVRNSYEILLSCEDQGSPIKSSQVTIPVFVTDINDHVPVFTQQEYNGKIDENNEIGVSIVQVQCSDRDDGVNSEITYTLLDDYDGDFIIEEDTGIIRANTNFDYESIQEARLRVEARDNGDPPKSATSLVVVYIADINDEPPEFTKPNFSFIVRENQMDHVHLGSVLASDKDTDSYSRFWYYMAADTPGAMDHFKISRDNGSISLIKPLDRETQAFYHLTVTATNYEPPALSATTSVTIFVEDINDNVPFIDFPNPSNNTVQVSNRLPPGYKVTQIRAHDLDSGENAELSFFLAQIINSDSKFGIDPKSGEIFLNHDVSHIKSEIYNLKVIVKDNGIPELTNSANITVVVNQSLAVHSAGSPAANHNSDTDKNMTIIIIVVAISGVIIIVLLGSIVFVLLSSRRKHPGPPDNLMTASVVMDNLDTESNRSHDDRNHQNGITNPFTATKKPDEFVPQRHEDVHRYVPVGVKPFYSTDNATTNNSNPHRGYSAPLPPRGVYVNYNARHPAVDLSFVSEESDQTKQELQALTRTPSVVVPGEADRASASSADDSVTDSGRGASEEGDPTSGDDSAHPRSQRKRTTTTGPHSQIPPPVPPKKELLLAPDYGLKQLQTQFDPHYKIKYNNLDSTGSRNQNGGYPTHFNAPDILNIPSHYEDNGFTNPNSYNKQTVRNVKAKDKNKKVDGVSAAMNCSSVFKRYRPETDNMRPGSNYNNPAMCTFSDATSLMNYKFKGSGCLSELTDATSETSATSGSYIIEHDDDTRGVTLPNNMLTVSNC